MKIHNYTGHPFVIRLPSNTEITLPVEGDAQVQNSRTPKSLAKFNIGEIPVRYIQEVSTIGLPDPLEGHMYIVSWPVARLNLDRHDLLIGDEPMLKNGKVIAVKALAYLSKVEYDV